MWSRRFQIDGLRALVILAFASAILLGVSLTALMATIDGRSAAFEASLVRLGYAQILAADRKVVEDTALWDAAVEHNVPTIDPAWLQANMVVPSPSDLLGGVVIVFGDDDRPKFLREHARPMAVARQWAAAQALAPLIAKARALETAGAPSRHHAGLPSAAERVGITATVIVQGSAYGVIVCRIDSPSGRVTRPVRAPFVTVLVPVQDLILPNLTKNLRLSDVRLAVGGSDRHAASAPLTDGDGQTVAVLSWAPRQPGTDLIMGALPTILIVTIVLGVAILMAYREGTASARALTASEARANHLAQHDQLTGLPNRRLMRERLSDAVRIGSAKGERIALLALDLDQFKAVNDTYGHPCGDELIVAVGARLLDNCRDGDVCARLGGDEFIVLAHDCDAAEASALAERFIAALCEPVSLSAASVRIGVSIGISMLPGLAQQKDELMRQADVALYRAKEDRSSTYHFYTPHMDQDQLDRRGLEADLRAALRDGAVCLAYQPQFRKGVMVGVEALARWTHQVRGAVPPSVFVPLAEQCGLIEALGWAVTRRAFVDSRRWPDLRVCVNLSALQIRAADFLPRLRTLVAETLVRPSQLEFEITEGVLMDDDALVAPTLTGLRAMGFGLALDDFGTGYCSLSYLRRFPISRIKIDRSFVTPLPNDGATERLVGAIIHLAHTLDLSIIAEGVETQHQRDSLAQLGCDEFQGYYGGRPGPAEDIDAILAAQLVQLAACAPAMT